MNCETHTARPPAYLLKWSKIQIVPLFFRAITMPYFVERKAFSVERERRIYHSFIISFIFTLRPSLYAFRFPLFALAYFLLCNHTTQLYIE